MKNPALVGGERDRLLEVELRIARRADELAQTARWDRRDSSAPWRQAEINVLGQPSYVETAGSPASRQPWDLFGEAETRTAVNSEPKVRAHRQPNRKDAKFSRDAKT